MKIKNILTSSFWLMTGAVLVQQAVVASSSYWLSEFAQKLKASELNWWLLGAYLLSLLLPYAPGALAHHMQTLWNFEILEGFYDKVLSSLRGKIGLWNHEEFKNQKESLLIKDGPQYFNDLSFYIFDVISISLNAILNITVVVWLLDAEFLIAYALGLLITFILLKRQNQENETLAMSKEKHKNSITKHLSSAWDHWTLDNSFFLRTWGQGFLDKKQNYKSSLGSLSRKKEFGSVLLSLASFFPTLVATLYFADKNSGSFPDLLNLTILLPRLFMILGHTTSLVYLLRDYVIMRSRAQVIKEMEEKDLSSEWDKRINSDLIKVFRSSLSEISGKLNTSQKGYWTVTGANGSGKSSWLMKLKEDLGEKACYLPPKSSLGTDHFTSGLSTGQKIKEQIRLAIESNVEVLLLDEWDANLDNENRQSILGTLSELGQKICVIDIRHRL